MKNYKLIFSLLLLTAVSCRKVIEIKETDFIGGDVALKTVENNESGIIGAYAGLNVEMAILLNSTFSDEVKKSNEFYNAATTHEWQFGSTDVTIRDNLTAMSPFYATIDRANRVMAALPNADSTRVGDNTLKGRLRGEALFLRAYSHFELFRFYCDNYSPTGLAMPYMESPSIRPQARIDMATYFSKLKADLDEAKNLLPNNLSDVFRANRIAVSGLQARIALYMRDWANAVTYSSEYISALPLASRANFPGIWQRNAAGDADVNNLESAFKLKKTNVNGGRLGSIYRNTSASASAIGTVVWVPSDKLWDSYDQVNDIRFSSYLKSEPNLAAAGRQPRIVQKYAGTGYGTASENVADAKVFRTGEMYLIRAEARAELGQFTGASSAESDINELRNQRIANYVPVTFSSKQQAIDEIMQERFKELPFEGHRFWDLKRRGLPVQRLASDAPTPAAQVLPAGNFRFLLPIPDAEIKANPLIQQNPGF